MLEIWGYPSRPTRSDRERVYETGNTIRSSLVVADDAVYVDGSDVSAYAISKTGMRPRAATGPGLCIGSSRPRSGHSRSAISRIWKSSPRLIIRPTQRPNDPP